MRESQQSYKDLYGNLDKRPEKIINFYDKIPNLIAIVGCLLPVCFFPDLTQMKPLSVPRFSTVTVKYQGCTLNSHKPTKLSQLFLVKMFPQLKFHRRIQGQRFFFHFNPLATQSKPCQRGHAAVSVPNESLK